MAINNNSKKVDYKEMLDEMGFEGASTIIKTKTQIPPVPGFEPVPPKNKIEHNRPFVDILDDFHYHPAMDCGQRLLKRLAEFFNVPEDGLVDAVKGYVEQHHKSPTAAFNEEVQPVKQLVTSPAPNLPNEAPALWLERENRKQLPLDFIQDNYRPWLGNGLTRSDILHLDKPLYMALAKWLQSNEMPSGISLPTKKELNDRQLAAGVPSPASWLGDARRNADPETKERLRLYEVARSRERRGAVVTPK